MALLAGISLSQISEFSFLFLALAFAVGLVDEELVALAGLVGLIGLSRRRRCHPIRPGDHGVGVASVWGAEEDTEIATDRMAGTTSSSSA